jgi:hypothetical protein
MHALLGIVTMLWGSLVIAQTVEPKGLIIYKLSGFDPDSRAIAAEYTEIQLHPNIVNGRKVDGSMFRIISREFVDYIEYPDLIKGVYRTPEQIDGFKAAGRKMVAVSEKYSSSRTILAPRIQEMKLAADQFNQGQIMLGGKYFNAEEALKLASPSAQVIANITTIAGESIPITKFIQADETSIKVAFSGGIKNILWIQLTEPSKRSLEENQGFLACRKNTGILGTETKYSVLEEDDLKALDLAASLFFEGLNGKRLSEVPVSHQGTYLITFSASPATLHDLMNVVKSGDYTVVPDSDGIEFSLSDKRLMLSGDDADIKYISSDLEGETLCILAGNYFFLKNENLFVFFDIEITFESLINVLKNRLTNEAFSHQAIIQTVFFGRRL